MQKGGRSGKKRILRYRTRWFSRVCWNEITVSEIGHQNNLFVTVFSNIRWKTPENVYRQEPWKISNIPTIVKKEDVRRSIVFIFRFIEWTSGRYRSRETWRRNFNQEGFTRLYQILDTTAM